MMNLVTTLIRRLQAEDGQALAEYGLILAFVAAVAVSALVLLGGSIGIPISHSRGLPG